MRRASGVGVVLLGFLSAGALASCQDGTGPDDRTGPPGQREDPRVAAVKVSPKGDTLTLGDTVRLRAVALDSAGREMRAERFVWRASDTAVAIVSTLGLVTAYGPGSARISASARGGAADSAEIFVSPIAQVRVSPSVRGAYSFVVFRLTAVALGPAGDTLPASFVWASSDTAVVSIDSTGLARTRRAGTSLITATAGLVSGASLITVEGPPPGLFVVSSNYFAMLVGDTLRLRAMAAGTRGGELYGAVWSSSDTTVAVVDSTGLARGKKLGTAQIMARIGSLTGWTSITVATITAVQVTPDSAGTLVGDSIRFNANASGPGSGRIQASFVWSSSDTIVAVVDSRGVARGRRVGRAAIRAAAAGVAGEGTLRVVQPSGSCAAGARAGTIHSGVVTSDETWTAAGNPHRIKETAWYRARLVIEPGVLVCADPGAKLLISAIGSERRGVLLAQGTPEGPIVFTATYPLAGWAGIELDYDGPYGYAATNRISNVRIEHAATGVFARTGSISIDSTLIRQGSGSGIVFWYGGRVSHTTVDSMRGGIFFDRFGGTLEDIVVRGARGLGVAIRGGIVNFRNLRIEGSADIGLTVGNIYPNFGMLENIRIVGGGSYPASLPLPAAIRLITSQAASDSLRGNARDTLLVYGSYPGGTASLFAGLAWRFHDVLTVDGGTLRLYPGAVAVAGAIRFQGSGRLVAEGTKAAPVTISGSAPAFLSFAGAPQDTSRLVHTRLQGLGLVATEKHPVVVDRVRTTPGSIGVILRSSGSRLLGSVIDRPQGPGVVLGAPGVFMEATVVRGATEHGVVVESGDVRLSRCEVYANFGDGVRFMVAGSRVNDCNLERNGGVGVHNFAAGIADARFNWWGDPAGPHGPHGDGVGGDVDFSGWRSGPVRLVAAAASVSISPSAASVVAGDTLYLEALARDSTGQALEGEVFRWISSDSAVARVNQVGTVLGRRTGSATIAAVLRSDTTLRASAGISVSGNLPDIQWTYHDVPLALPSTYGGAFALWAASPTDVFVGGERGQILRFNGAVWTRIPIDSIYLVRSLWGTSPTNVYAGASYSVTGSPVGGLFRYDGTSWTRQAAFSDHAWDVHGTGPKNIFVAGSTGVWRFDGSTWTKILDGHVEVGDRVLPIVSVSSVWARSQAEAFASVYDGKAGRILRWDGSNWTDTAAPLETYRLWGVQDMLHAVGALGRAQRRTGTTWEILQSRTSKPFHHIHGTGPNSVFAVGDEGVVRYFDASHWLRIASGFSYSLTKVWSVGNDVFVLGHPSYGRATLLHGVRLP